MIKSASLAGLVLVSSIAGVSADSGDGWVSFAGGEGPGKGKHVVLLAGDEEYRSEEALPMLAKILSERHGFKTTVVFSIGANGEIDPKAVTSMGHPQTLDSADALVTSLRFRVWPDEAMKKFEGAVNRGVPIVALRTSTHLFNFPKDSTWASWSWNDKSGGFGKKVIGETWVTHWGKHGKEATRGVIEPGAEANPLLRGVTDVFGDTDVYEAYPPADATLLLRGAVLENMEKSSQPAAYEKTRASDKGKQPANSPMMPIAWSREVKNEAGTTNKVLTTTMGAATDLSSEGLRRLVVNGVFWGLGLEVPAKADVTPLEEFVPSPYKNGGSKPGLKAADFEIKK